MAKVVATEFVGMGKRQAQNHAEFKNLTFRLVEADGEKILGWPEDVQTGRVCCIVKDSKVTEAYYE